MKKAIYPGTFDPITYGHLDVIKRASLVADELIVGVLINNKKSPMFSIEERVEMIKEVVKDIPNVRVEAFGGLQAEFAKQEHAYLIRGLRAVTDFEYELQISQANRAIYPEVDTLFIAASLKYAYLSSSIVREVASYNGDISAFVPESIRLRVMERVNSK